jgi:hypothetical protein
MRKDEQDEWDLDRQVAKTRGISWHRLSRLPWQPARRRVVVREDIGAAKLRFRVLIYTREVSTTRERGRIPEGAGLDKLRS